MLLVCVESDKIPLLQKLKQLYKHLLVGVLIAIKYTANDTVQVNCTPRWQLYFLYGL